MISGLLLLLVLCIHFWMVWIGGFPGDSYALAHFHPWTQTSVIRDVSDPFSPLGTAPVAAPIIVLAALLLVFLRLRPQLEGLVIVCLAPVMNELLKWVFGPSPAWAAAGRGGLDFPSGHVVFVTAVIGYLGILAWRRQLPALAALAALLVVGIGPTRVLSGVHMVSDVAAGYLLGAAFLVAALGWVSHRSITAV